MKLYLMASLSLLITSEAFSKDSLLENLSDHAGGTECRAEPRSCP